LKGRSFRLACFLALALLAGAYANSLENVFHFDDSHVLINNLWVRDLGNAPRFFADASTFSSLPANATYRPLVTLSLALDYALAGGLKTPLFHASQLLQLVVLGAALLVFYRRLFDECVPGPENRWLALFAAGWFCLHTTATETMNLMHARSEILSALGIVVGLLIAGKTPSVGRTLAGCLPMAFGALAKPPAVLYGPLLGARTLLRDFAAGIRGRRLLRPLLPALLATAVGVALFLFIRSMDAEGQTYGGGDRRAYALTQVWVWVHYLRLFFLPVGLSADTDWGLIAMWHDTRVLAGAAILAALAGVTLRWARKPRLWPAAYGLVWFALGLLPTSSVLPLAEPLNEHRVFLPYVGLVMTVTWAGWRWIADRPELFRWRRWAVPVALAILVAHAAGTVVRNRVWRSGESLWADTVEKSPRNGRAWMNYGLALMGRGDYPGARRAYEAALPLVPRYSVLAVNMAILAGAENKPEEAEAQFQRALALAPATPSSHLYYARWLVSAQRGPEAIERYREAVRLAPSDPEARGRLADLLAVRGDLAGAKAVAIESLRLDPNDRRARAYAAGVYPASGDTYERRFAIALELADRDPLGSAVAYRSALELRPDSADALNNLGWTLGRLGFYDDAAGPLVEAVRLRPDFTLARNNLSWVLQEKLKQVG
jgi:Flp pilus assembly protein TadD